jgi:hypothetical protein
MVRYTNSNSTKPPAIVQVIGTLDQVVSKDDVTDKQQFPHATIIQIPGADHDRLFDPNSSKDRNYTMITLLRPFVWTREQELLPDRKKNNVVILLHGIRASALHWPNQLAPLIAEESDFMVLCPDYGYFTALRFAIPRLHRRPLRWFQDQYSNVLADNPSATFHFVGHSNGTYLLGQSMLAIKGMQFKRVFLGGCALPAEFPWDDVPGNPRFKCSKLLRLNLRLLPQRNTVGK